MSDRRLERWHSIVFDNNFSALRELLSDDVAFHSPTVWHPKEGAEITHFILQSAIEVFESFVYHREWIDGNDFALEFSAQVGDQQVKGIDLIRWNDEGKIVHFEVMLRPLSGVQLMFEKMTEKMAQAGYLPNTPNLN